MCRATMIGICAAAIVLAAPAADPTGGGEELRQCPGAKCGRYALSDTWNYCPYCGTKLPAVKRAGAPRTPELVLGNIYKNRKYAFQIERPNTKWKFLRKGAGLEDLNDEATVGMSYEELYCVMIVERMPKATLAQYSRLIAPDLPGRVKLYQKTTKLDGADAMRLKWSGKMEGIPLAFYQTLIKKGDVFYQIVCWCAAGNDTKAARAQFEAIQKSFRFLSAKPKKTPATKPAPPKKARPKAKADTSGDL